MIKEYIKKNKILVIIIIFLIGIISFLLFKLELKNKVINNINYKQGQINEEKNKKGNTISTEDWDLEKVNIIYDSEGIPVPVPKGFVGSNVTGENTINTGFVIYETDEEVNNDNAWDMQISKNQFVWIPIYNPEEIYGRDEGGIARGKLYTFTNDGRRSYGWSQTSDKVMVINENNNYEPIKDTVDMSYVPDYLSAEVKAYNQNFETMIMCVEKYGGFYIGRYETGFDETVASVHKMNINLANKSCMDLKNLSVDISNNENVMTEMIYGCQMDAVYEWLCDTGCKTYEDLISKSNTWGNYVESSFTYIDNYGNSVTKQSTKLIPTGSSEYTRTNNIYDLAGNVWERTQETWRRK